MLPLRSRNRSAFTLIELLTVMAIIGLLVAALVVAIGPVQKKVNRGRTKSQFSQYISAYELFKTEYKYYPRLTAGDDRFDLKDHNEVFIQTFGAKAKDGSPMTNSTALQLNKKRIPFYSFQETEFFREEGDLKGQIVDAFGNPNISIVVDSNNDGVIPSDKLPQGSTEGASQLNAKVAVFSSTQAGTPEWEDVYSW